jgi:serine/threonine protein kinase
MKNLFYILLVWSFCLYGRDDPKDIIGKVLKTEQHSYELHQYLSRGAFGSVYDATNEEGKSVAIKVFSTPTHMNSEFFTKSWPMPKPHQQAQATSPIMTPFPRNSFRATNVYTIEREWEIGTQFDHPNIIKAYDRGTIAPDNEEDNESSFLVLELVSGSTLYNVSVGQYSRNEAMTQATQLLDAFCYGLSNQMHYTDLHSGNIMISDEGLLKIIDLGSFHTFESLLEYSVERVFWDLQYAYLLIKTILKKGGYEPNEVAILARQLKDEVKKLRGTELTPVEMFRQVFDAWSVILHDVEDLHLQR